MAKYESDSKEDCYKDRNLLVQLCGKLAAICDLNMGVKFGKEWSVLYIELPSGQVSWHVPTSDFVSEFPDYSPDWDGHDLELKRERIIDFIRKGWN